MTKSNAGFSLVEIVVAIGLFAFVAVAILSLFSVALKTRADSHLEGMSTIIANELFSSIKMSGGIEKAMVRDGPALQIRNNQSVDLTKDSVVIGYPINTTTPFGLWHSSRGQDPKTVWEDGKLEAWAINNQIATLAYLRAERTPNPNLYKVICEIRSPAILPKNKSHINIYTTLFNL